MLGRWFANGAGEVANADLALATGMRLLLSAEVNARCRQVMGTVHGIELFPTLCPEISLEAARSIADFCRGVA